MVCSSFFALILLALVTVFSHSVKHEGHGVNAAIPEEYSVPQIMNRLTRPIPLISTSGPPSMVEEASTPDPSKFPSTPPLPYDGAYDVHPLDIPLDLPSTPSPPNLELLPPVGDAHRFRQLQAVQQETAKQLAAAQEEARRHQLESEQLKQVLLETEARASVAEAERLLKENDPKFPPMPSLPKEYVNDLQKQNEVDRFIESDDNSLSDFSKPFPSPHQSDIGLTEVSQSASPPHRYEAAFMSSSVPVTYVDSLPSLSQRHIPEEVEVRRIPKEVEVRRIPKEVEMEPMSKSSERIRFRSSMKNSNEQLPSFVLAPVSEDTLLYRPVAVLPIANRKNAIHEPELPLFPPAPVVMP